MVLIDPHCFYKGELKLYCLNDLYELCQFDPQCPKYSIFGIKVKLAHMLCLDFVTGIQLSVQQERQ